MGELGSHLLVETFEPPRLDALDVLVEGVDEDPEGEVSFEVGAQAHQDDVSAGIGASGEFRQQPGLADPGLGIDGSDIGWTITSYSLVFGSLLLLGGRFADLSAAGGCS